jgi:hypothetical protein
MPDDYVIIDTDTGDYLESFDPDVGDPPDKYPTGLAVWTNDIDSAMKFATNVAAIRCWQTPSTTCPLRPDGKPNRPLSVFSVLIESASSRSAS